MQVLWGAGGMLAILAIAFALSTDRRAIRPRTILAALAIQIGIGVVVLYWEHGERALLALANGVEVGVGSANEGIDFLFGPILPDNEMVFAFQVLPIIVFIASVTAVLYHWNILQWVVRIVGGALRLVLGTSRPESMAATANVVLGQTESPLVVRPYLARMSRSEFFAVMVCGLSTVAGTVLVGYSMLGARMEYLLAAAFMAAPAGLLMAKIIVPEPRGVAPEQSERSGSEVLVPAGVGGDSETADRVGSGTGRAGERSAPVSGGAGSGGDEGGDDGPLDDAPDNGGGKHRNVIDAAAGGASEGLKLALNIGAMLLAFISLIALLNMLLGTIGGLFGVPDLSFQQILGYVFAPVMSVIGVPWEEAVSAGSYLGQKIVLNEFVAFAEFAPNAAEFSDKTVTITTFALTGFANFGSLAILLGGLGSLVPHRRPEIAQLGVRAILAGTLANLLSATIAGVLV
ncbi:NupC/NupG family nucleoside CNT transporter [Haloechinothrix sp. YIM 98757]|uniref:NupC/NupG family nucleoside CNT transporter n=1 Tax=Haloechinothrix aidingensis TaxID=2752311 RepID=A0A838AEV0_9PSEU|nr:NupC/NupG family nucleoside CNT transporter [Haloechinothrix aidingensis]MBA0127675.1 NupC/NupG family nucleoside CNT transporter [Haloechinothrix aidingensis]